MQECGYSLTRILLYKGRMYDLRNLSIFRLATNRIVPNEFNVTERSNKKMCFWPLRGSMNLWKKTILSSSNRAKKIHP